jgi:HEAT repeat protein
MTRHVVMIMAAVFSSAALAAPASPADQIVADYLKLPFSQEDRFGQMRSQRSDALLALESMPDAATEAIGRALPLVKDFRQRIELAGVLGRRIQTREAATLLVKLLDDPNDTVRWEAIHNLRMLSQQTDRSGPRRMQREPDPTPRADREQAARQAIRDGRPATRRRTVEPKDERNEPPVEFAPKVEGLVPYLVAAANDDVEANRVCAMYALADTRDPRAVAELRARLKDPSEKVRLYAACFLTEYQDASGLTEMQAALARLSQTDPEGDHGSNIDYYSQAGIVLASFERITGRSFGLIPMSPYLSSSFEQISRLQRQYKDLVAAWAQWWAWEPPVNR